MKKVDEVESTIWDIVTSILLMFMIFVDKISPGFTTTDFGKSLLAILFVLMVRMVVCCIWEIVRYVLELRKDKKK